MVMSLSLGALENPTGRTEFLFTPFESPCERSRAETVNKFWLSRIGLEAKYWFSEYEIFENGVLQDLDTSVYAEFYAESEYCNHLLISARQIQFMSNLISGNA